LIIFALPTFYYFSKEVGFKKGTFIIIILSIYAICIESFAIETSFPYGAFEYTNQIGVKFGEVPITLPFAWVPLCLGAYTLACQFGKNRLSKILLGIIFLVGIDFVLDPAAVYLEFWIWEDNEGFYGVPWSNFLGWILSSSIAISFLNLVLKNKLAEKRILIGYIFTLVFMSLINLIAGFWIAFIIGILLFGLILYYW
jgi:putative membrane protein